MAANARGQTGRRFLFCVAGGSGHLHPLVPLARTLQQRGHEVAFATSPSQRPTVESAGFATFPVGGALRDDPEYQQLKAHLRTMTLGLESELFAYPRIFCSIATRLRTPELVVVAREWRPDMLIREAGDYAAVIAAEHHGLPHATVAFTAALRGQAIFEREAAAALDPIRERWGLAPDPTLASLYRYLYLAYSPPSFAGQPVGARVGGLPRDDVLPATTHFIRPEFFDHANDETLPDWSAELPSRPTVYVTLGTVVNSEPELYPSVLQTIIAGLRDAPINLIVTLGREKDPAELGLQPGNVHIERYIPQSLLLGHCDVMVMHAGSNTLLAALDVGLPTVAVPLIADQFFNAEALGAMRLGRVVQRGDLTPASICAAVEDVLDDATYRQNVERVRAEMYALPDQQYAAGLVERVARQREPVVGDV